MKHILQVMAVFAMLAFAPVANAEIYTVQNNSFLTTGGMNAAEVGAVLDENGITFSKVSDTELSVDDENFRFYVRGFNCTSENRCTEWLFIVGIDLPNGFPMEKINEWNATALGGRAYLDDEGDPWLDHIVSVSGPQDKGAMTEGLILWAAALIEFSAFLDAGSLSV